MHEEDEIRNRYVATFFTDTMAVALAKELLVPNHELKEIMRKSRGNHAEIEKFLRESVNHKDLYSEMAGAQPGSVPIEAIFLLYRISEKDLRDTPVDVLLDHLDNTPKIPENLYEIKKTVSKAYSDRKSVV